MLERIIIVVALSLMIAGTAVGQIETPNPKDDPKKPVPNLIEPDRYRLQPNDVLEVQYRLTPEHNETVTVQPDGFVNLPLIGDLKIGDLTLEQIKKVIFEKVSVRLKDPEITLKLKEFEKPYFVISGHVRQPGRYDFRGKTHVSEAIAIAGGFTEYSYRSQVLIFRKLNSEWSQVIEVNLNEDSHKKKKLVEDISLKPGDMVFIPENKVLKIERIVRNIAPFNPFGIFGNLRR